MSALYTSNPHLTLAELVEMNLSTRVHVAYLRARIERNGEDSKSGKRAAAEIARLQGKSAPAPVQVSTPAPAKPARKTGPGSRGGKPANYVRAQLAARAGHVPNSPEWWAVYRSESVKAAAAQVTTFAQAKKVLANA